MSRMCLSDSAERWRPVIQYGAFMTPTRAVTYNLIHMPVDISIDSVVPPKSLITPSHKLSLVYYNCTEYHGFACARITGVRRQRSTTVRQSAVLPWTVAPVAIHRMVLPS